MAGVCETYCPLPHILKEKAEKSNHIKYLHILVSTLKKGLTKEVPALGAIRIFKC